MSLIKLEISLLSIVLSVIVSPLIPSHTFTYLASLYPLSHTSSAELGSVATLILPATVSLSGVVTVPIQTFQLAAMYSLIGGVAMLVNPVSFACIPIVHPVHHPEVFE